jgi:hypothetical protein
MFIRSPTTYAYASGYDANHGFSICFVFLNKEKLMPMPKLQSNLDISRSSRLLHVSSKSDKTA